MGEVYRARDTRLGRDVALKILPAAFAGDADRAARFQREAHLLGSLNHPRIATLYGFEVDGSHSALVMELVPGPTLAERIVTGALPLDEALKISLQIAEAFEDAHEHGVIHRDMKPANVKLTSDGTVKVLDFGLAKAVADDAVAFQGSAAPTVSDAGTRSGILLGTPAYMSPEQAEGRRADRRSDVWSFGVVLFEMLSGKRPFRGAGSAETRAAVMGMEPDWAAVPAGTPARVRRLLRRCLEKDPRRRVQAIGEMRIALEDALAGVSEEPSAAEAALERAKTRSHRSAPWLMAVAASVLALGFGLWAPWRGAPKPKPPLRLSIDLGADATLSLGLSSLALSPDGSMLAFAASAAGGARQLYVRRLDQAAAAPLPGTDNAQNPFFSPDGGWIAFFAAGKLKKVATTGGAAVTLCDAPADRGGTWAEDGTIVFAGGVEGSGLWRIPQAGGKPELFAKVDPAAREVTHRWPQALPGGRFLFTSHSRAGAYDDANLAVYGLPGGPPRVVHRGGYLGRYVRSGHLVYMHRRTLFAVPFDLERLEVMGPAAPALEGVASNAVQAGAHFTVADEGTLAFLPGQGAGDDTRSTGSTSGA